MKKILLLLLITAFSLVLFGCTGANEHAEELDAVEASDEEVRFGGIPYYEDHSRGDIDLEDEEVVAPAVSYEQWAIPSADDEDGQWIMTESMKKDCVGVANGITYGGDLLSSLIVDGELRGRLNLGTYSKSYVINLEKKLAKYTQRKFSSDFYASSSCNLDDGVDLVSGYLWPTGNKTAGKSFSYENGILLLVNGEDVLKVDDSVRLLNQTATGAEVFPCDGALEGDDIKWTCFLGLADEGGGDIVGSNMGDWIISSKNGDVLEYDEYIDRI